MLPVNPKFNIGDTVYAAYANWDARQVKCPDCLGTAEWTVTAPSGESWQVRCNTCNKGWHSSGYIGSYDYLPEMRELTIGSVRIDTNDENPISYMCVETGVGSGTIHYEKTLFGSKELAMEYAIAMAKDSRARKIENDEKSRTRNKKERIYKSTKKVTK